MFFYFFGQLSFPNIVLAINMTLEDVALHADHKVLVEFDVKILLNFGDPHGILD